MATKVDDSELIAVLLVSPTREEAAKKLGISTRTIYNRLHNEEFARAFEQAKRDRAERLGELMDTAATKALEKAIKIIDSQPNGKWAFDNDIEPRMQIDVIKSVLSACVKR